MDNAIPMVKADDYTYPDGWPAGLDPDERARHYCGELETGNIVYFEGISPYNLPDADREFLLSQKQSGFKGHKNVSYRPGQDAGSRLACRLKTRAGARAYCLTV